MLALRRLVAVAAAAPPPTSRLFILRSYSSGGSADSSAPPPRYPPSSSSSSSRTPTVPTRTSKSIPFVPSTDHLLPSEIAFTTFFALHRPLSVTPPAPAAAPIERHAWEHGLPFSAPPPPSSLPSLIRKRRRRCGVMYAISVRRQRKLKMKKHKYKKLMKKTRNLRRRIERQKN